MSRDWFSAYVEQELTPTSMPGDTIILDNLPAHKDAVIQAAIEGSDARLCFLRPCSPDFNSIEIAFAKFKVLLRNRPRARSIASGLSSEICSTPSPRPSAQTTSLQPVTTRRK